MSDSKITAADREAVEAHRNQHGRLGYEDTALHFAAQLREAKAALAEADAALISITEIFRDEDERLEEAAYQAALVREQKRKGA